MNSNKVCNRSQEKSLSYSVSTIICGNEVIYLNSLNESELRVFDLLLNLRLSYAKIFFSQESLADMAKVSLSSIKRALNKFEQDGIVKIDRYHRHTNFYDVTTYFFQPHLRRFLGVVSRSIMWASLLLAASKPIQVQPSKNEHFPGYELPLNKQGYLYNKIFEERDRRSVMYESVIPPCIQELHDLKLTEWGKMEMSKYPESAIRYAMSEFKRQKGTLYNPYGFFVTACKRYCTQNNLEIQWRKAKFLQETYKMPVGAPLVEKAAPTTTQIKKTPQKRDDIKHIEQDIARRISIVEDNFALALKAARECIASDNAFKKNLAFVNPWFNRLTLEQQQQIRDTVADKMSTTQPTADTSSTFDAQQKMNFNYNGSPLLQAGQA